MSPRQPNEPDSARLRELRTLGQRRIDTDAALKAAVLRAIDEGASVRTVAAAAQLSTATVQTWKRAR